MIIKGKIQHGSKQARTFGTPTANIYLAKSEIDIPEGIYAGILLDVVPNGELYRSCIYISHLQDTIKIESFAFEKTGLELYDKNMQIFLGPKIRDNMKFDCIQKLESQILKDVENCKQYFFN